MKLFKQLVISLLFLVILSSPAHAQEGWDIDSFDSNINILPDGHVEVTETIKVDFANLEKHGIFRDIPFLYENNDGSPNTYTQLDIGEVTINGSKVETEITRNTANLRIKIGDPDKTISGPQTYVIKYTVAGILYSYDTVDELYWNVTGNEWGVPMKNVSATVTLPKEAILQLDCYQGYYGDNQRCTKSADKKTARFQATRQLSAGEGLTVALGFEKGTVPILRPQRPKTFWENVVSPTPLFTFFATEVIGLIFIISQWWKKGRDSWLKSKFLHDPNAKEEIKPIGAHETIVVEFDPPDKLRPAELGTLMDEKADTLDVSATIIDLAGRGFLDIVEVDKKWAFSKTDYELKRKKKNTSGLLKYEKTLLDELFDNKDVTTLSSLKNKFYQDLATVKSQLYEDVVEKNLFPTAPDKVRAKYLLLSLTLTFVSVFILVISANLQLATPFMFGAGLVPTACMMVVFSRFMSKRTAHGRELYRRAKGYELFLSKAEKYRQQFFERKNLFNEILPYTIVLGLTEKFANAFKELGIKPPQPTWYVGTHPFNATTFSTSINSFSHALSSSIASAPSSSGSSGGGFSGGGGGGGGGGSW